MKSVMDEQDGGESRTDPESDVNMVVLGKHVMICLILGKGYM